LIGSEFLGTIESHRQALATNRGHFGKTILKWCATFILLTPCETHTIYVISILKYNFKQFRKETQSFASQPTDIVNY